MLFALTIVTILTVPNACERGSDVAASSEAPSPRLQARIPQLSGEPVATLLLSKAAFTFRLDGTGRRVPVPSPAKLVLLRQSASGWEEQVLEDPQSIVFHKAISLSADASARRLLTIAGSSAALKIWDLDVRTSTTIWQPNFGGKWDRLRDIEIGDITGDGSDDLVVATHDRGVVGVLSQSVNGWQITELSRSAVPTFVHEIEIGDIDGDGLNEFFATPSQPNLANGESQPGEIVMYRYRDGAFEHEAIDAPLGSHAKEILAVNIDGRPACRLLAAIEATTAKQGRRIVVTSPVVIREYRFEDGSIVHRDVATLDDKQCRFLCAGDVDGDGRNEVVASGMNSGVWLLRLSADGDWSKSLIDSDSSAYEHATLVADLDGDGVCEIYVAADRQHEIRRYRWDRGDFKREVIARLPEGEITFHIGFARL